jgi:hypothetical protein
VIRVLLSAPFCLQVWPSSLFTCRPESWDRARSFALHKALADVFPGRFNTVSPAAVALHCTMDLLQDAPIIIALSPDTDSEHDYRPEPESLRGDLLLADRGYLDLT